ncbi:flagellar biosynthesis anti-sigma factor FlgM [Providencia heimbachae]|uniref:Negative regulator of flagellin synthesis n=1 Tax=Providencia heimbachae ATCC 35613 TaxID=1354272 RepID=A0A1B7K070_9GAMM|nr:flagellar biosynthesis anti-sigma factor FlgM [Providencia heimbachae]MDD9341380.1 flagellar biosynthesis anti-sigma factor FlgM [Providencia heimbachae]OAT53538.1 FlgM family negative regulator of flagellin synthesis [Providencia heimbachae ATCC 35613]QCJ70710.1 flagellar biosynthesis anti-sigma factor FlgM [Providencia heimbachae]SQH13846.1 Anti-sigma-28 factor [Providencia heimbachae]
MAIEQTSAISALTQVTNRDPQDATAPMRDKKVSANEAIKESAFAPSELQKKLLQPQATDIDSAKVEKIKQAIKDGTLKMDAEKIADGILRDAHECMLLMK